MNFFWRIVAQDKHLRRWKLTSPAICNLIKNLCLSLPLGKTLIKVEENDNVSPTPNVSLVCLLDHFLNRSYSLQLKKNKHIFLVFLRQVLNKEMLFRLLRKCKQNLKEL